MVDHSCTFKTGEVEFAVVVLIEREFAERSDDAE